MLFILTAAISFWVSQRTTIYLDAEDSRVHFKFALAIQDLARFWAAIVAVCSWVYKAGRSLRKLVELIPLPAPADTEKIEVWRKWIAFGPSAGAASTEASAQAGSVGKTKIWQAQEGE